MEQDYLVALSDFLASNRLLTLGLFVLSVCFIKRFFCVLSSYGALVVIVGTFGAMSNFDLLTSYEPLVGMVFIWCVMRFIRFLANRRHRRWVNNQIEQMNEPAARDSSDSIVKQYLKKAKRGDAEMQCALADAYRDGKGVKCDYDLAVKWYRRAANQDYAEAQYRLGVCYYRGDGVDKSFKEAAKWYRKAAEQGHTKAQTNLGISYWNGQGVEQSYAEAAKWYRKAADRDYADAQNLLANSYENGTGVARSYQEAVKWYRKAAEQNHAGAQYNLAKCYEDGTGVEQSKAKAIEWYEKAAMQDFVEAEYRLSCFGVKCKKFGDWTWFDWAVIHGHAEANYRRGNEFYTREHPNYNEASGYFCKAAMQGHIEAQYRLGMCYSRMATYRHNEEAAKWYRAAAEQGHVKSQFALAEAYRCGRGVEEDKEAAALWYRKAAEQGHLEALWELIIAYDGGRGVPRSHEEVIRLYRIAAEKGEKEAQEFLLEELEKGKTQRETFTIFGISLGEPCPFPTRKDDDSFAGSTHVVELQKPFRHFTEAKIHLTQEQQLVESLTLQCALSPTQAVGEVLAIREALEEKFDLSFKESEATDECNHGFDWDFVARTKGAAIYLESSADGTVCLHIEYQNDYALFVRDQRISQDNEVASDLDAL